MDRLFQSGYTLLQISFGDCHSLELLSLEREGAHSFLSLSRPYIDLMGSCYSLPEIIGFRAFSKMGRSEGWDLHSSDRHRVRAN